ncbi:hypothetical protein FRC12_003989 [Ceratobasidium sp. 428]|nr:hypothetical protein FRC12_003989 [Ceratobasidium sp. 428]
MTVKEAEKQSKDLAQVSTVTRKDFLKNYLNAASLDLPTEWTVDLINLWSSISELAGSRDKETLYSGSAPLLSLLNSMSKRVFDSLRKDNLLARVFRSSHLHVVKNVKPRHAQKPDIIAAWENAVELQKLIARRDYNSVGTDWQNLSSVGEVKKNSDPNAKHQLAGYLRVYRSPGYGMYTDRVAEKLVRRHMQSRHYPHTQNIIRV